jgi:hypothetical protein
VEFHYRNYWCVSISLYTTTMATCFTSSQTHCIIQSISCVNYSLFPTVNENSFHSFSPSSSFSNSLCKCVYHCLARYIMCSSTHLHGIRADGLLRKSYTKIFCKYKRLKTTERWNSKKNSFLHLTTILHGRRK